MAHLFICPFIIEFPVLIFNLWTSAVLTRLCQKINPAAKAQCGAGWCGRFAKRKCYLYRLLIWSFPSNNRVNIHSQAVPKKSKFESVYFHCKLEWPPTLDNPIKDRLAPWWLWAVFKLHGVLGGTLPLIKTWYPPKEVNATGRGTLSRNSLTICPIEEIQTIPKGRKRELSTNIRHYGSCSACGDILFNGRQDLPAVSHISMSTSHDCVL